MGLRTSEQCIAEIKLLEGFRPEAYQDAVCVWTIGYGSTGDVRPGDRITEAEADRRLRLHIGELESVLSHTVKVPLTQKQWDALIDFEYNLGTGASKTQLSAAASQSRQLRGRGRTVSALVSRRRQSAAWLAAPAAARTAVVRGSSVKKSVHNGQVLSLTPIADDELTRSYREWVREARDLITGIKNCPGISRADKREAIASMLRQVDRVEQIVDTAVGLSQSLKCCRSSERTQMREQRSDGHHHEESWAEESCREQGREIARCEVSF